MIRVNKALNPGYDLIKQTGTLPYIDREWVDIYVELTNENGYI